MSATHGRCVGCHRRTGSGLALMGSEQFMSSALVMLGVDEARADSLLWRLLPQLQGPTLQVRACRRCGSGFRLGRFSSGKLPLNDKQRRRWPKKSWGRLRCPVARLTTRHTRAPALMT